MTEIPKAPVLKIPEVSPSIECQINRIVATEWAKLFEGAEVVYGEGPDDVWGVDKVSDDRYSAILLKPVAIKKPGVTRVEIECCIDVVNSRTAARFLQRILDEGLADG